MAQRRPLVQVGGSIAELPAADTLSVGAVAATTVSASGNLKGARIAAGTISTPTYTIDIGLNSSIVDGFQIANINAGPAAQIQNRLLNDAGATAYFGITSSTFSVFPPLNGGRVFFGSYNADTIIFTQSANAIRFLPNGSEQMTIAANGLVTLNNVPTYSSDGAAGTGGLTTGQLYKAGDGSGGFNLKIKG